MKRIIRRILPAILAALMIISTLPADLGFSMTAYAGNSGNDVRIGGSGEAIRYDVTVNVTINNLKYTPVDGQNIEFGGKVFFAGKDQPIAPFTSSGNDFTSFATFSCGSGDLEEGLKYEITCDNYIITDKGSTPTIKGTFKPQLPETSNQVTANVTIDASNWEVTPNFPRATTLTLSAEPATDTAKWGETVTLTAEATSNSENNQAVIGQSVQFYVDNDPVGSPVATNDSGVATYKWTSAPGTHTFKAESKETNGGKYADATAEISGYTLQPHTSKLTLTVPESKKPWNEAVEIKAALTYESGAVIKEAGREITFTFGNGNTEKAKTMEAALQPSPILRVTRKARMLLS